MAEPAPVRLADEFFLIAWDTANSGRPTLHVQATALGLAGTLLGELVLQRRVMVRTPETWVADPTPVEEPLTARILNEMKGAPQHTDVRTWLAYLATERTVDSVAERLVRAGLVVREETRSLLRRRTRYLATDFARGAWPSTRLELLLVRGHPMSPTDMALAAFVEATGLLEAVVFDARDRAAAHRYLATLKATTPRPLRDLAGHVRAAVGDAVLSYRS